jgi:hypothetical protein
MASALRIHASAIFLLLIIANWKVRHGTGLKCHYADTEFHENRSNGSSVETGEGGIQTDIAYTVLWSRVPVVTPINYFVLAASFITNVSDFDFPLSHHKH